MNIRYELVPARDESYWLRNIAPWFLRVEKQRLAWLFVMEK